MDRQTIRVFLLDDHELVRRGLRDLLSGTDDMEVVGEAGTADEALLRIAPTRPNVVVADVRLPDGNGIEVCREIKSQHPEINVLMLTSFSDDDAVLSSIMAGAAGYLLKQIRGNDLVSAIRKVAAGEALLDAAVTAKVLNSVRGGAHDDNPGRLTVQEQRILDLIAEGLTNRQIAEKMFLAEKTVKNYVSNLLSKLGMSRRTEAAVFATRLQEQKKHALGG